MNEADEYRLKQAERLLADAGFYEHSDGNWYPEPENAEAQGTAD